MKKKDITSKILIMVTEMFGRHRKQSSPGFMVLNATGLLRFIRVSTILADEVMHFGGSD